MMDQYKEYPHRYTMMCQIENGSKIISGVNLTGKSIRDAVTMFARNNGVDPEKVVCLNYYDASNDSDQPTEDKAETTCDRKLAIGTATTFAYHWAIKHLGNSHQAEELSDYLRQKMERICR